MEKVSAKSQLRPWRPMQMQYVGEIGKLMQGGTFSRVEPGNAGRDKGVGGA
jgi:hypothetical protein